MSADDLAGRLAAAGARGGDPVALAVAADGAAGVATAGGSWGLPAGSTTVSCLAAVEARLAPRWVWWSARSEAATLVAGGLRPAACWDLAAVHRLLHGGSADGAARVWASAHGLPPPAESAGSRTAAGQLDLLADPAADDDATEPIDGDGQLRPEWTVAPPADAERARQWAMLALAAYESQRTAVAALPDRRAAPGVTPLPLLTARAESAAELLAVELAADGLPVDVSAAEQLIGEIIGPRPSTVDDDRTSRERRDDVVFRHAGTRVDLRNPAQVRTLLASVGVHVPDTRSWRLEPLRDAHPVIGALLAWRRAERIATTYGYGWLDRHVGQDGRLRGPWRGSDGGAGRMTAGSGLHNLPAELRTAVVAEPGHVFVRADLGQVEPRVLAAVSGDPALAAATAADDLYLPVADQLRCDRPRAKVAVLAAMYGQTSGTAGAALREMQASYPRALGFLEAADRSGREGRDVRTVGGRLVRVGTPASPGAAAAHGRYARNAVVQGAAAELFKAWAVTVRAALPALRGRIVLCLHDELLLHVPAEHADAAADLVHRALADTGAWWAAGSGVRLVADVTVVRRWSDAKS